MRRVQCLFLLAAAATVLQAQVPYLLNGCHNLPPIDPNKDFLGNFNNSCYALPMSTSKGNSNAGDLNALYSLTYYQVTPGYELVVSGNYPNARFFSVTAYDAHSAVTGRLLDTQVSPLTSAMKNPYQPFTTYAANQQWGITVGFGGGQPVTVAPGCSTSDTTIDKNFIDASQIHPGITWTGYPGLPSGFPAHVTGPNIGGYVMVRAYQPISTDPAPVMMVRQLSNGCAVPLSSAGNIISNSTQTGGNWHDQTQISAHEQFAYQIEPIECFPPDPINQAEWSRSANYVPGDNDAAAYLSFNLPSIPRGSFIRMQFQMPSTPTTPCSGGGCSFTGVEQLRYRSLSFLNGRTTLASLKDSDFVRDANGNVTLIIGLGTAPPSYVTAANDYTYYDLSKILSLKSPQQVDMRDLVAGPGFQCSGFNVPFLTTEYNPEGGYMGNYVPTVDYPTGAQIPTKPVPINRANTCAAVVTQTPVACGTQR